MRLFKKKVKTKASKETNKTIEINEISVNGIVSDFKNILEKLKTLTEKQVLATQQREALSNGKRLFCENMIARKKEEIESITKDTDSFVGRIDLENKDIEKEMARTARIQKNIEELIK